MINVCSLSRRIGSIKRFTKIKRIINNETNIDAVVRIIFLYRLVGGLIMMEDVKKPCHEGDNSYAMLNNPDLAFNELTLI